MKKTTAGAAGAEPTEFQKLAGEIADLAKALPVEDTASDDAAISAAAEDGAEDGDKTAGDKDKDGDKADVTKSFKLKLDDGTEVDAVDGTELIKALGDRQDTFESNVAKMFGDIMTVVKSQAAELTKLRSSGRGRRAVVSVAEAPKVAAAADDVNKSHQDDDGMKPHDFLMKAESLYGAGKISARAVQVVETCINTGRKIPDDIIRAVMAS